jgi:hypothetical protein
MANLMPDADQGEWEEAVHGRLPYWQPEKGYVLHGKLLQRYEIKTRFRDKEDKPLPCALYTVLIFTPASVIDPDTGECVVGEQGTHCVLLERAVLKNMADLINREVVIFCKGKKPNRAGNPQWEFIVKARKLAVQQIVPLTPAQKAEIQQTQ